MPLDALRVVLISVGWQHKWANINFSEKTKFCFFTFKKSDLTGKLFSQLEPVKCAQVKGAAVGEIEREKKNDFRFEIAQLFKFRIHKWPGQSLAS